MSQLKYARIQEKSFHNASHGLMAPTKTTNSGSSVPPLNISKMSSTKKSVVHYQIRGSNIGSSAAAQGTCYLPEEERGIWSRFAQTRPTEIQ